MSSLSQVQNVISQKNGPGFDPFSSFPVSTNPSSLPGKTLVQKFGGTSVGSIERIFNVARLLIATQKAGARTVGVVSAMSGETNRLVDLATQINPQPWSREYDMLLASGEQVSVALVSMAIHALGGKARPLLGYQLGIHTDQVYSKARIQEINTDLLEKELRQGVIPVVAGFQGVDVENNITTLGRGGSDTSAVAIAAALKADMCEIFTDVDGVYTTDPRLCPKAKKIQIMSYDDMMELASLGAKVLQIRSVELGAKYKVPILVCSSFESKSGTLVVDQDQLKGTIMEHVVVSGIAAESQDAKITLSHLPDRPGVADRIFGELARQSVIVDVIVMTASEKDFLSVSFTVPRVELPKALDLLKARILSEFPNTQISSESNLAKVSIVGAGMRHHPGVASKMFSVLAQNQIDLRLITTSEIKVSVLIPETDTKKAVAALHSAFGLDSSG